MEEKWTPGPWRLEKGGRVLASPATFKATARHPVFVVANNGYLSAAGDEMIANACLIAAAPELYKALQRCAMVLAGEDMNKSALIKALESAQSAMLKARGES